MTFDVSNTLKPEATQSWLLERRLPDRVEHTTFVGTATGLAQFMNAGWTIKRAEPPQRSGG